VNELNASDRVVLDALLSLRNEAVVGVAQVRDRAAELGHARSIGAIRRALGRLVEHGYASRLDIRARGRLCARYAAVRRYGETVPAVCEGSTFLTWLWEARLDWELWSVELGERSVRVDNWRVLATPEEWEWLASRPIVLVEGDPKPDEPAWWDGPLPAPTAPASVRSSLTGERLPSLSVVARARRENLIRSFDERRSLLADSLGTNDVSRLLNTSTRAVRARARAGTLLAVPDDRHQLRFPSWQFDAAEPDGVVAGLRHVLAVLRRMGLSPFAQARWLQTPKSLMAGQSPLEALRAGDVDDVIADAEALQAF
jgi:hypothetical protein